MNSIVEAAPRAAMEDVLDGLTEHGYAVVQDFLPDPLRDALYQEAVQSYQSDGMHRASIGHGRDNQINTSIRGDSIVWLDGSTPAQRDFLERMGAYRALLNQALYLGINNYEAHFAYYPPGRYYRTHWDNFRGRGNRIVTTVLYLNPHWSSDWGGELVLYAEDEKTVLDTIVPQPGMLATFMSAQIPHEVRPTHQPRVSIAGWMRRDDILSR